ncbi:MAG: hypothetical protein L0338_39250, partial [Acidobacteria bacterium]|nr:hypothetical protein [Acidobacteriota bacterium]
MGIFLLIVAGAALRGSHGVNLQPMIVAGLGFAAIGAATFARIRWEVPYKGHTIRFENHPWNGERLYIDGELVARGGLGIRMVMQATLKSGDGAGDSIEAVSVAGLFGFRCL